MPSSRTLATVVLAVAMVVSLLFAGTTPLAAATPAGDGGADDSATFASETFADHRGDVVRVPVALNGTTGATVKLGDGGSVASVSVGDEDGDGRVALRVNTYLLGRDADRAFAAAGADTAVVRDVSASGTLPAGTYDLTVTTAEEATVSVVDDEATLRLREPAVRDLRVGVAEVDERANLTSPAAIRAANRTDRLHDRSYLVDRGLAVLELEAAGLSGALAAQDGPNETARFFSLLERPDVTFTAEENASSVGIQESATTLDVASHDATDVVADLGNDTYYLLVDVDAAVVHDGERRREFERGDRIDLTVTVAADSNLTSGRQTATAAIRRTEWDASVDDRGRPGELAVAPAAGQVVTGETNVPQGSPVTVTVRDRSTASVVQSRNVTVGDDGRFLARFDLGELRDGTPLAVEVRFRGRTLAFRHGVVEASDADVAVRDLRWNGSLAVVADATLEGDGFVVVHADSPDGPVLGYSDPLAGPDSRESRTYENVAVPLDRPDDWDTHLSVVLHRDTPTKGELDFGDEPYFSNGSVVATTIEVPITAAVAPAASPAPPPATSSPPLPALPTTGTSSSSPPPAEGTSSSSPPRSVAATTTPGSGADRAVFALAAVAPVGGPRG